MPQPHMQRDKDSVRVDPQHYSVDLENDRVRVLRAKYGPHEKSSMHSHPTSVIISLKDARFRMTNADGRIEERNMRAGEVYYSNAEEHLPENLTGDSAEVIVVELKR